MLDDADLNSALFAELKRWVDRECGTQVNVVVRNREGGPCGQGGRDGRRRREEMALGSDSGPAITEV
jgi:hypothetical protein